MQLVASKCTKCPQVMFLSTLYLRPSDVGTLFPLYQAIPRELFLFSFFPKIFQIFPREGITSQRSNSLDCILPLVMFILLALMAALYVTMCPKQKGKLCYRRESCVITSGDVCCWTSTAALGTSRAPNRAYKMQGL